MLSFIIQQGVQRLQAFGFCEVIVNDLTYET